MPTPEAHFKEKEQAPYSSTCQPLNPFKNKGRLIPNHTPAPRALSKEEGGIPACPHIPSYLPVPKALSGDRGKPMPSHMSAPKNFFTTGQVQADPYPTTCQPPKPFQNKGRLIPNHMPAPKGHPKITCRYREDILTTVPGASSGDRAGRYGTTCQLHAPTFGGVKCLISPP